MAGIITELSWGFQSQLDFSPVSSPSCRPLETPWTLQKETRSSSRDQQANGKPKHQTKSERRKAFQKISTGVPAHEAVLQVLREGRLQLQSLERELGEASQCPPVTCPPVNSDDIVMNSGESGYDIDFSALPPSVDPEHGGRVPVSRSERKREQLVAMLRCCLKCLVESGQRSRDARSRTSLRIVELCSGSGHVILPLVAILVQRWRDRNEVEEKLEALHITLVDMNVQAIATGRRRILNLANELGGSEAGEAASEASFCKESNRLELRLEESDSRLTIHFHAFTGMVSEYGEYLSKLRGKTGETGERDRAGDRFDLGIALHACGRASDESLELCCASGANFVVAPCCIGRVAQSVRQKRQNDTRNDFSLNDFSLNDAQNAAQTEAANRSRFRDSKWDSVVDIQYPRSRLFRDLLTFTQYRQLAKAADFHAHATDATDHDADRRSDREEVPDQVPEESSRKLAKLEVERDRLQYVRERYGAAPGAAPGGGYSLQLVKMPVLSTPKNDILVGIREL